MLGSSASHLNVNIAKCLAHVDPKTILEYGCGQGKLGSICQTIGLKLDRLDAVQKLFHEDDMALLSSRGYSHVFDEEIYAYVKQGIGQHYNVIAALDVIEHFMYGEAISIIDSSLYRCDYFLMVWPSKYPQQTENPFETHRTSFELREIANRFDVVYYALTGLAELSVSYKMHIALLRGHMNFFTKPPVP